MKKYILLVLILVVIVGCGVTPCAQTDFDICEEFSEGEEVQSCDSCNTCRCYAGPDGKLYPACTEIGCL